MPSSLAPVWLAASLSDELRAVLHDLKVIYRAVSNFFVSLERVYVLGIPCDTLLHFVVAALIFLIAARFLARWKAAILVVVLMVAKEAWDIPAKLAFLREGTSLAVSLNSLTDLAAGTLGLLLALGITHFLGARWRARSGAPTPQPLPAREPVRLGPAASRALPWVVLIAWTLYVLTFELHTLFAAGAVLPPLVHAALFALGWLACARLGPANALLLVMALLPLANWLAALRFIPFAEWLVGPGFFPLADWLARFLPPVNPDGGVVLIFALVARECVRRIRTRDSRLAFGPTDWPLVAYAVLTFTLLLFHSVFGPPSIACFYWFITPLLALSVYFLARESFASPGSARRAVLALALSFLAICVIGLIEFLVRPRQLEVVPGSLFEDAPHFSVYLALLWPLLLAASLGGAFGRRGLYRICVLIGAVAIGVVFVRSCWVACGGAVVLIVILFLARRDWALGAGSALALVGGVFVMAIALRSPPAPFNSRFVGEIASIFARDSYARSRGSVVEDADRVIRESPLLGEPGRSAHTLHHAHAVNYGIPATVLAALAIASILACGWVRALRSRKFFLFVLAAGVTAAVLASVLEGFGWSSLIRASLQPYLWCLLGLLSAAVSRPIAPASSP